MRVEISKPARKDLLKPDEKMRTRILNALADLREYPDVPGIKKIKAQGETWRLRVGEWRVIFEFDEEAKIVNVLHVKHRKEAYR